MLQKNKVFSEAEVKGQDFDDTIFHHCKFVSINFRFTNFTNCVFEVCDFSESFFDSVSFFNCRFPETKLSFLDFGNASITNCDFSNSVAENCFFQKLKGANKSQRKNFDLRTCKFDGADLIGTIFVMCNLNKINFQKSILERTVFERCDLEETDFREAKIEGCGFTDCKIKKTILDMNGFIDYGSSKGFTLK